MANPSNRSPSPLPARQKPNSAARRSSGGAHSPVPLPLSSSTGRRSLCSSCPPSPSNSPADSVRRGLQVKEDMKELWDCSEKENERAAKLRSPAKGSKNFMSPTVSAASKFNPSPKKKVLVERNERTSISQCDSKGTFLSSISLDPTENSVPKHEIRPSSKPLRKVTFSETPLHDDEETNATDSSDSLSNETCLSFPWPKMSPGINYASPRPQFICYSPKPRPKQLNESFVSVIDSLDSDSESQIEVFHKESDESSSTTEEEMVVEEEPKSLEEEMVLKLEEESPEGGKKSRIFICFKWALTVFFLMVAACVSISVTDRPVLNGYEVKDVNLADASSYWESQVHSSLNNHHFRQFWIPSSLSTYELSSLLFTNSTCLIGGGEWELKVDRVFEKLEEEQDHELDDEAESEDLAKEDDVEEEDEDDVADVELGGKAEVEDVGDEDMASAEEDEAFKIVVGAKDDVGIIELDSPMNDVQSEEVHTDFADTMEISVLEAVEDDILVELDTPINDVLQPEEEEVPAQFDDNRKISGELDVGIDDHHHPKNIADEKDESFSASQMHQEEGMLVIGILHSPLLLISAVAVAAAAAGFMLVKQNNRIGIGKEGKQETVVNAVTDSGPSSEVSMSCNNNSTSRRRRGRRMAGEEEEEKPKASSRRESVATSDYSWGSLSYGSFTTFERIPLKHHHLGNGGGEEGMTPVRRSSRIRSQVLTSPS